MSQQTQRSQWQQWRWPGAVTGAFLLCAMACSGVGTSNSSPSAFTAELEGSAQVKRLINPHLKAPSTADYPVSELRSRPLDCNSPYKAWLVLGAVDAQNSFGAKIRNSWYCVMVHRHDEWDLVYCVLEDGVIYGSEQAVRNAGIILNPTKEQQTKPQQQPPASRRRKPSRTRQRTWETSTEDAVPWGDPFPKELNRDPSPDPTDAPDEPETPTPTDPDRNRTWTDATGQYSVDAEFRGVIGTTVKLRKADGTEVTLPLEKLSEADREWIQQRAR